MKIRHILFPILAALIWGTAFVAQSVCTDYVPPFAFNAIRSFIAVAALIPTAFVFDAAARRRGEPPEQTNWRQLVLGGFCCGAALAVSANLQQAGLADTSAGKAGFITAFYVVLVPVLGLFLKKYNGIQIWISIAIALIGLYLLCIKAGEGFFFQTSDLLLISCALFFAVQILVIDHFIQYVDGVKLSCVQFIFTGLISAVLSLIFETVSWSNVFACLLPILYVGVFSSGVAYTLQILAQKDANPTVVSLLFSLEAVFSVIAGAILLGDRMTVREYLGCVLMFAAVILAQAPLSRKN